MARSSSGVAAGVSPATDGPAQRRTRQRDAMNDLLADERDFRTARQLYDQLRSRGENVGLTTVYRTLQRMHDADELDVIQTAEGESAYRRCSDAHHHHLVCRSCGHTVEVVGRAVETWAERVAEQNGFHDIRHDVEIFGLCAQCHPSGR